MNLLHDIALLAPSRMQAEDQLTRICQAGTIEHARFFALGLDEYRPRRYFDEVHWLPGSNGDYPRHSLGALADIVHVHQWRHPRHELHPGFRHYLWDGPEQMAAFWSSLYRARADPRIPGLDWHSYAHWNTGPGPGRSLHGHGASLAEAVEALASRLHGTSCKASEQALLIIEAGCPITFGDYVDALERLGSATGLDVIPTGWQAAQGYGCGLWLLLFSS